MDSAKRCGFLATRFFLLLNLLGDPTEACFCTPNHPQTAYCNSDFVIMAKFQGHSTQEQRQRFEIKITKVFKGSEATQRLQFLYSNPRDGLCGFKSEIPPGEKYVIAGSLGNNFAWISACSFVQPWAKLPPEQKKGIREKYSKGCFCDIVPCFPTPCAYKPKNQCLWLDKKDTSSVCLPVSGNNCDWVVRAKAHLK